MDEFRKGSTRVLITTDVWARGLDVQQVRWGSACFRRGLLFVWLWELLSRREWKSAGSGVCLRAAGGFREVFNSLADKGQAEGVAAVVTALALALRGSLRFASSHFFVALSRHVPPLHHRCPSSSTTTSPTPESSTSTASAALGALAARCGGKEGRALAAGLTWLGLVAASLRWLAAGLSLGLEASFWLFTSQSLSQRPFSLSFLIAACRLGCLFLPSPLASTPLLSPPSSLLLTLPSVPRLIYLCRVWRSTL